MESLENFFSVNTACSGWAVALVVFLLGLFIRKTKISQKVKGGNNLKVNQEINSLKTKNNDGISQEVDAKDNVEVNQKY